MDFILQRVDKIIRTYGNEVQIALVTIYHEYPWLRPTLRQDLITEAKQLSAEHGTDDEYDDICAIASWLDTF